MTFAIALFTLVIQVRNSKIDFNMGRGVPTLVAQVARATPIFLSTERGNLGDFKFPRIPKLVSNTNNFDQITPLSIKQPNYLNYDLNYGYTQPEEDSIFMKIKLGM